MRIFVINAYPKRREKYLKDKRYEIFPAVWWEDVSDEEVEKYHFRWNAKEGYRKKVVACSLSHKNLMKKIIHEDLKEVVIIEDDALVDFDRLGELKDISDFCYIGGQINAPVIKDFKKFEEIKDSVRDNFTSGVNKIDSKEFRLIHACGYYIPNAAVAQGILSNIPANPKERAIDVEFLKLQRKKKITDFIYPAIVSLYLPEANEGFNYSHYKLLDDQSKY